MASEQNCTHAGTAFLQGACVGAFMALLFAPYTGREFREQLKKQAEEGRGKMKRWADDGREKVEDVMDKGREAAQNVQRRVSSAGGSKGSSVSGSEEV